MNQKLISSYGKTLSVKVTTNAKVGAIQDVLEDGTIKISLRSAREGGKANTELIRLLERETREKWEIIAGKTATRKKLRISSPYS